MQESWRAQLEFEILNAKNGQELNEKLRFRVSRFLSGRKDATIASKVLSCFIEGYVKILEQKMWIS